MSRVRIGVVGCGDIALREHLAVLATLPDARVVAIADPLPERKGQAEAVLGHPVSHHHDGEGLLARGDLDAVLIATPNDSHAVLAEQALAAGLHLFLEKPMATTPQEALRVARAAEASGRVVQVGYVFRYAHLFERMAGLVAEGAIGRPRLAWCTELRRALPAPWRYDQRRTGGVLVEKSCHHFDLFRWMLGQPVRSAAAFGGQAVIRDGAMVHDILGNRFRIDRTDVPDHLVVALDYEGGARATLTLAFFAPFRHRLEVGVHGEEGLLVAEVDQDRLRLEREGRAPQILEIRHPEGLVEPVHQGSVEQHRSFLAAVRGEGAVRCDVRMGLEGLWPAFLGERALAEGRVVSAKELPPLPPGVTAPVGTVERGSTAPADGGVQQEAPTKA